MLARVRSRVAQMSEDSDREGGSERLPPGFSHAGSDGLPAIDVESTVRATSRCGKRATIYLEQQLNAEEARIYVIGVEFESKARLPELQGNTVVTLIRQAPPFFVHFHQVKADGTRTNSWGNLGWSYAVGNENE